MHPKWTPYSGAREQRGADNAQSRQQPQEQAQPWRSDLQGLSSSQYLPPASQPPPPPFQYTTQYELPRFDYPHSQLWQQQQQQQPPLAPPIYPSYASLYVQPPFSDSYPAVVAAPPSAAALVQSAGRGRQRNVPAWMSRQQKTNDRLSVVQPPPPSPPLPNLLPPPPPPPPPASKSGKDQKQLMTHSTMHSRRKSKSPRKKVVNGAIEQIEVNNPGMKTVSNGQLTHSQQPHREQSPRKKRSRPSRWHPPLHVLQEQKKQKEVQLAKAAEHQVFAQSKVSYHFIDCVQKSVENIEKAAPSDTPSATMLQDLRSALQQVKKWNSSSLKDCYENQNDETDSDDPDYEEDEYETSSKKVTTSKKLRRSKRLKNEVTPRYQAQEILPDNSKGADPLLKYREAWAGQNNQALASVSKGCKEFIRGKSDAQTSAVESLAVATALDKVGATKQVEHAKVTNETPSTLHLSPCADNAEDENDASTPGSELNDDEIEWKIAVVSDRLESHLVTTPGGPAHERIELIRQDLSQLQKWLNRQRIRQQLLENNNGDDCKKSVQKLTILQQLAEAVLECRESNQIIYQNMLEEWTRNQDTSSIFDGENMDISSSSEDESSERNGSERAKTLNDYSQSGGLQYTTVSSPHFIEDRPAHMPEDSASSIATQEKGALNSSSQSMIVKESTAISSGTELSRGDPTCSHSTAFLASLPKPGDTGKSRNCSTSLSVAEPTMVGKQTPPSSVPKKAVLHSELRPAKTTLANAKVRATAKLQEALKAKKRVLQAKKDALERARKESEQIPEPIHALLKGGNDSLLITRINAPGATEKIYFAMTRLLDGIDRDLKLNPADEQNLPDLLQSISLLKRKQDVEARLVEARERQRLAEAHLKKHQDLHRNVEETTGVKVGPPLTRDELLRRRKVAERKKAITHFRHLIAKQEHLEQEQNQKLQQILGDVSTAEKAACDHEAQLQHAKDNVLVCTQQCQVLADMIADYVSRLVDARKMAFKFKQSHQQSGR